MALNIIFISISLTILALILGYVTSKANFKIKHLVDSIKISSSKPMSVGAIILIASSSISAIFLIVNLFSQYGENWTSDNISILNILPQSIALTNLLLYISLGIALLKKSSFLLLTSPSFIIIMKLIKKVYFDTSTFSALYRDYLLLLPAIAVSLSLIIILIAISGFDKIFSKYNKLISIAPWMMLLPLLDNVIEIISTKTIQINMAINCISVVLDALAFVFIFKALISLIGTSSITSNVAAVTTTKEKWIIALSIILLPLIINIISSVSKTLLLCITFVVALFLVIVYKITEKEKTKVRKNALAITTVIVVLVCIVSTILPSNDSSSSTGCGHPECEENGPFPCYGKNNTCPNFTDCYKDLYCDQCD